MKTINSSIRTSICLDRSSTISPTHRASLKRLSRRQERRQANAALLAVDAMQALLDLKRDQAAMRRPKLQIVPSRAAFTEMRGDGSGPGRQIITVGGITLASACIDMRLAA
jgi:hypothetical protein